MAREIERKFLLVNSDWKEQAYKKTHLAQAYLNDISKKGSKSSIRVRIEGEEANFNIKSLEIGMSRDEYEYPISLEDATKMIKTLAVGPVLEKYRYLVEHAGYIWELDEFLGDNTGLVIAEVELKSENEQLDLPEWVGKEVTELTKYYNISLTQKPYKTWNTDE